MDRCLEEATAAIAPLCTAAVELGERYRDHDLRPANQGLVELADGLTSLIGIVGAAGLALHVDATTIVSELGGHLEALVTAQEASDWLTVADVLQFDIEPSLKRLRPLLASLRQGQPAAG
jgi:hypothetical protein